MNKYSIVDRWHRVDRKVKINVKSQLKKREDLTLSCFEFLLLILTLKFNLEIEDQES